MRTNAFSVTAIQPYQHPVNNTQQPSPKKYHVVCLSTLMGVSSALSLKSQFGTTAKQGLRQD